MEILKYIILAVTVIYLLVLLILAARSKKAFKFIFLNLILGVSTFLILYFTKKYTALNLNLNPISLGFSSLYGVVGVIGILLLNLII